MIEQIKSFVLIILVGLSLILTYQLWYGQQPAELIAEDVYERIVVEKPRPLEEAITPIRISVAVEEGLYLLKPGEKEFDHTWQTMSELLINLGEGSILDYNPITEGASHCLTVYFKPPLPTGGELPWLPGGPYLNITEIELICLEESKWLILKDAGETTVRVMHLEAVKAERLNELVLSIAAQDRTLFTAKTAEELSEFLERDLQVRTPVYLPLEPELNNRITLTPESIDRDLLLKTFFVDYNLARVIEERDGGLIYTDGEKGLRLTDLSLEYSYPRLEEGQTSATYREALTNSSALLSYHGGWPSGLRLQELSYIARGDRSYYISEWVMYHQGKPIYTKKPTRALFNDLGLFDYTRSLYNVEPGMNEEGSIPDGESEIPDNDQQAPVADGVEALQKAVSAFDANLPGTRTKLRLEAINLGYAVTGTPAEPYGVLVWFVQLNGERFLIKADDMSLINEEDLL